MKLYVFLNENGEFICKKAGNVYVSKKDVDKMLTYRKIYMAECVKEDSAYWEYRKIGIDNFNIVEIDLNYEVIK